MQFDFNLIKGNIKPVHGVNNAARKTDYGDLLPAFVDLHVPFSRLHDTGGTYGGSHYVDIANVFPDFSADPEDESCYDFTLTDYYIRPLAEAGIQVMYRLGTTIEHEPKKYRIFAPADPEKWANVAEHIVRHYNDGWAEGFHWHIVYWEVWNEPDGLNPACEPFGCPNWIGTAEDYYRLYSLTANRIKSLHPEVKVGGYSSCYILGKFENGRWEAGDASYFTNFLQYISAEETKAPLDFFTWHGYLGCRYLEKIEIESDFVDKTLNEYGFTQTNASTRSGTSISAKKRAATVGPGIISTTATKKAAPTAPPPSLKCSAAKWTPPCITIPSSGWNTVRCSTYRLFPPRRRILPFSSLVSFISWGSGAAATGKGSSTPARPRTVAGISSPCPISTTNRRRSALT